MKALWRTTLENVERKRSGQVGGWYDMSCRSALVRSTWHWRKGIQDQAHFGNLMKRTEPRFVVCVKNKDYPASLELRKLYQIVSDETAAKLHQIRVIDESGEGYLYPEEYFVAV
jgi:hypothetical protein